MRRILAFCTLLLSFSAQSETWLQFGDGIECPDALELRDQSYTIFNDCYGFDPRNPVIETGQIEKEEEYIYFSSRKVKQVSFLQDGTTSLKLKVLLKTDSDFHLQSGLKIFKFKIINVPN
ncbi:MAG: hypothetical protein V7717_04980 [Porticoccaceae bacterium]